MEIVMGGIHDLENRRFLYKEKDFMSEDDKDKLLTKSTLIPSAFENLWN